jgi:hypothetical protein
MPGQKLPVNVVAPDGVSDGIGVDLDAEFGARRHRSPRPRLRRRVAESDAEVAMSRACR